MLKEKYIGAIAIISLKPYSIASIHFLDEEEIEFEYIHVQVMDREIIFFCKHGNERFKYKFITLAGQFVYKGKESLEES